MNEEACDLEPRGELEPVGSARRFRTDDDHAEIWRFPRSDENRGGRLLTLGARRVGGFVRGGLDAEGVWLVRRAVPASRADRGARPWPEALGIVHALAGALAACESRGLFPGPLQWAEISLDPPGLVAEALVRAIAGAPGAVSRTSAEPSLKWTPPEQAAGASWDSAANRYVLGLVAYRLVSGKHPFEGAGLRHAAQAQAAGEPAPFEEEIAASLKPGVQSFVLRLLAVDAKARPASAQAIAADIDELLRMPRAASPVIANRRKLKPERELPKTTTSRPGAAHGPAAPSATRARLQWVALAPIVAGALAALGAVTLRADDRPSIVKVPDVTPLGRDQVSAASCGTCHAREYSEWSRSAMSFSAKSPLYGALESLVEEQFGRSATCPNGAGVLRRAGKDVCVDDRTRAPITGAGGEEWCINCHSPKTNLDAPVRSWSAFGDASGRRPAIDLLSADADEGVSCIACHTSIRGVDSHLRAEARGQYEGNAVWRSFLSGREFTFRPEEVSGGSGIANSGYFLDGSSFFRQAIGKPLAPGDPVVHRSSSAAARGYRASSEFCGACHDVRLFGTDVLGKDKGEHFKRLRNAYSEWKSWARDEERAGRQAATCQGCHMSLYPGTCEPGAGGDDSGVCPSGTHLVSRPAGDFGTDGNAPVYSHTFTSVDVPLTPAFDERKVDDPAVDAFGVPVGLRQRQRLLLASAFRFSLGEPTRGGGKLQLPITIENIGAGHRVPAGFSQEREIWVELEVVDARGAVVYEVGHVESPADDLHDKQFLRVTTNDAATDFAGRPLGVFGADVADGLDVPQWSPNPALGGTRFFGKGLVNFQNGFLRCVRCIGEIDASGACQPVGTEQARTRAGRFEDGFYDPDTGECRSNLADGHQLFETYFPLGSLDADRGILKAPDAIIDTRSAPPNVPITYTYDVDVGGHRGPFTARATLHFRAFPPYLIKAFADYEANEAARGNRPNGPQVTRAMLGRLEVLDLADAKVTVP